MHKGPRHNTRNSAGYTPVISARGPSQHASRPKAAERKAKAGARAAARGTKRSSAPRLTWTPPASTRLAARTSRAPPPGSRGNCRAERATLKVTFRAICEGNELPFVSTRISRQMARVRACGSVRVGTQIAFAIGGQAARAPQAVTAAAQAGGRKRGGGTPTGGGSTHLRNGGPSPRAVRVVTGRRDAGDGGPSRLKEEPPCCAGASLPEKESAPEAA